MTTAAVSAAPVLQAQLMALVRALGLLEPDHTPCGQPVSASVAHALTELAGDHSLTQTDLGGRLRLEKSTVSRLVSQLESRGWVERRRAGHDGRVLLLTLTGQGRELAAQIAASRAAFFARLCERIPPDRHGGLSGAIALLVEALHERR